MTPSITRFRHLALAAAALLMLALPAAATAKPRDRNHDGIADKWAKRHHVRSAKQDPDRDGLNNLGEFRSGTDPHKADTNQNGVSDANEDADGDGVDNGNEVREHTNPRVRDTNHNGRKDGQEDADRDRLNNAAEDQAGDDPINPDTDGDGVKDGEEGAGRVVQFDGTQLVIQLFNGSTLSGTVDQDTEVWCGDQSSDDSSDSSSADDPGTGDNADLRLGADDSAQQPDDTLGTDDSGSDSPDDPGADDSTGDTGPSCTTGDIEVGGVVQAASLDAGPDGALFTSIELAP